MSLTTCQKVTLISCSVLCVSLFLPKMLLSRGKKDMGQPEVGPGFYPPMMHRLSLPGDQERWGDQDPSSHTWAHSVEAITKIKGQGRTNSLIGQVIPIYGFGILLYIVYIIYKLTCKGKTSKSQYHYTKLPHENVGNKTTDYELARLQQKLQETENMMDRIISGKGRGSSSNKGKNKEKKSKKGQSKKEEKLLKQLRQITHFMQEGRMEGASPEMEAEEVPYAQDWDGYPEETYPVYEEPYESRGYNDVVVLAVPNQRVDTAEALAERMEQEEEEDVERKLEVVQEEDEEEGERQEGQREEEAREEVEEQEEQEGEEEEEEEEVEEEYEEEEEEEELEEDEDQLVGEKRLLLSPCPARHATDRCEERLGLDVSKELQMRECHNMGKKQISFSEHKDVYHYPKEDAYEEDKEEEEEEEEVEEEEEEEEEEDEEEEEKEEQEEGNQMMVDVDGDEGVDEEDPVTEAESLTFDWDIGFNPEAEAEGSNEEYLLVSLPAEGDSAALSDPTKEPGRSGLRMRNRRDIRDS